MIRRFVSGDPGLVRDVASCIVGSSDIYGDEDRLPLHSINFISCHDGFTLYDLVSYNGKHNEAKGRVKTIATTAITIYPGIAALKVRPKMRRSWRSAAASQKLDEYPALKPRGSDASRRR